MGAVGGEGACFAGYFNASKGGNLPDSVRWDVSHSMLRVPLARFAPSPSESRDQWYAQIEREGRNLA